MPDVSTIRAGIAELPKGSPLVVALTGATSGVGNYVAKALARTFTKHGSKLRIYIVGRNASRAEALFSNTVAKRVLVQIGGSSRLRIWR
ncbi:hypothetical protein CC80DRAFT_493567 [Byssothecium circinans]|uniref:Uncharacterized protein n=1 Tax=Byssothecium circinans TaxID=147558 RepID=A0A6A5TQ29_9PLEO|nr:hypothetical protein CC80DRAFT_493567 [Byssothecium circinans]